MKIRNLAAVLGLTGGFLLAGQAQALYIDERPNGGDRIEIDDMFFNPAANSQVVSDTTVDSNAVTSTSRGVGGAGVWVNADGTRQGGPNALYVNLLAGDAASTEDCGNCNVSHTTNNAASLAHHFWTFRGTTLMADVGDKVGFDYQTDIDGADFFLTFSLNNQKVGDTFHWSDLAGTGLSAPPRPLCCNLEGTITQDFNFDDIRIDVFSNGGAYTDPTSWLGTVALGNQAVGLDVDIGDNIPAPGTLALLSLGMIGFGWQRRRARA